MRSVLLAFLAACTGHGPTDEGVDTDVVPEAFSLPDVVQTTGGPIEGYRRTGELPYVGFVGVPYAHAERFGPPEAASWTDTFDASEPPSLASPRCPQRLPVIGDSTDEDCLRVNIHVPDPVTPGTPVLLWLHGGGLTVGEGLQPGGGTSGHVVAGGRASEAQAPGTGEAIVVSVNYRLGALGWLVHEDIGDGNYGYLDVLAALNWVHDNALSFGGSPDNVTIVGESSGGQLVCMLMSDPGADGLYHRAIVQSSTCEVTDTLAEQQEQGAQFADAIGCGEADDVAACLREVPAGDIVDLQFGDSGAQTLGSMSWRATIDGTVVKGNPVEIIAAGGHNPVPLIWGFNAEEGNADVLIGGGEDIEQTDEAWREAVQARFDTTDVDGLLAAYPLSDFVDRFSDPSSHPDVSGATWAMAVLSGDQITACPTRDRVADAAAHGDVWAYVFDYQYGTWPLEGSGFGAFHFGEVQYVFGVHPENLFAGSFTEEEWGLHDAMRQRWVDFAADGDPGTDWPTWDAGSDPWMSFDATSAMVTGAKSAECAAISQAR